MAHVSPAASLTAHPLSLTWGPWRVFSSLPGTLPGEHGRLSNIQGTVPAFLTLPTEGSSLAPHCPVCLTDFISFILLIAFLPPPWLTCPPAHLECKRTGSHGAVWGPRPCPRPLRPATPSALVDRALGWPVVKGASSPAGHLCR